MYILCLSIKYYPYIKIFIYSYIIQIWKIQRWIQIWLSKCIITHYIHNIILHYSNEIKIYIDEN